MLQRREPLNGLFTHSKIVLLDFSQLSNDTPQAENIQLFFEATLQNGGNPRLPKNRQQFNNQMIEKTRAQYLIGRYAEDRIAMLSDTPAGKEGRTIHMAVDIFCKELEPVFAPANGQIVRSGYEEGFGEYGNYLVFQPAGADFYIFFGHLADDRMAVGPIKKGEIVAHLGDYVDNENGGWSRHLHLQILKKLLPKGKTPDGYSTLEDFNANSGLYPNPLDYFPGWQLR